MLELNEEQWLVIPRADLGTIQTLTHRGQEVRYRLPNKIEGQLTLRFRGHGKRSGQKTGDFLLHIRVDRGQDVHGVLWLSESQARSGCVKRLLFGGNCRSIRVPAGSERSRVLRLPGQGGVSEFVWMRHAPTRGDALISLQLYPDKVEAEVRSVEALSTEDLYLEGWIYRRVDEILTTLPQSPFSARPFTAAQAANLFNESGWEGVGKALIRHLGLQDWPVRFESSSSLDKPGNCTTKFITGNNQPIGVAEHLICIHSKFLQDPFAVAAILAHEFCHALEIRHFGVSAAGTPTGDRLLDLERTVDLLVFLFGLGEFQMRVARRNHMTLGYFNQELFERMHLIWSRKQKEFHRNRPAPTRENVKTAPTRENIKKGKSPSLFRRIWRSFS